MITIQATLFDHNFRMIRKIGPKKWKRKIFFGNPHPNNIVFRNRNGEEILRIVQNPINLLNPDNRLISDWSFYCSSQPIEYLDRGDLLLHPGDKIIAYFWEGNNTFVERIITIGSD